MKEREEGRGSRRRDNKEGEGEEEGGRRRRRGVSLVSSVIQSVGARRSPLQDGLQAAVVQQQVSRLHDLTAGVRQPLPQVLLETGGGGRWWGRGGGGQ